MATQDQLREIATRAMSDEEFAAKLQADPQGTLRDEGVTLSDEEKTAFNQMMEEVARATGRESKGFAQ